MLSELETDDPFSLEAEVSGTAVTRGDKHKHMNTLAGESSTAVLSRYRSYGLYIKTKVTASVYICHNDQVKSI